MVRLFAGVATIIVAFVALGFLLGHLPGGKNHGTYTVAQTVRAFAGAGIKLKNYWGGEMPSFPISIPLATGKELLSPTGRRFQHFNGDAIEDDFYVHLFNTDQDAQLYAGRWGASWAVFRRQANVIVEGNARAKPYVRLLGDALRRLATLRSVAPA